MTEFLLGQLDYAYFAAGLALVLLALGCCLLVRAEQRLLPWQWLGYFALLQGLNDWMRLLLHAFGVRQSTFILCLITTCASFGFLFEFARAGWQGLNPRTPGRWLLLLALGLAAIGGFGGFQGLEWSIFYGLTLPAGVGAGLVLWCSAAGEERGGGLLRVTALTLAAYTLTFGLSPSLGCSFSADPIHWDSLTAYTAASLQSVRTLVLWMGLISLWLWGRQFKPGEMDHFNLRIRRRLTGGMALTTLTLLVLGWLLTQFLGDRATQQTWALNRHAAQQFHYCLRNEMEETHSIVRTVAGAMGIAEGLQRADGGGLQLCNKVLDRFSGSFQGTVIYLMNLQGITVASSNRFQPDSFVGKSYAFRPYFQQAASERPGQYLALGMTSRERGFYASAPIYDAARRLIGVAVVKRSIDKIESILYLEAPTFLVGPQGIIFLASEPEMTMKSLWPLDPVVLSEIIDSRQFGSGPFPALLSHRPASGSQISLQGRNWLYLTEPSPCDGWQIGVLGPTRAIVASRLTGIGITLFLCLSSLGLFWVWDTTLEAAARVGVSERIYRSLVEGAPDCVSLFDREGKFLMVNPNGWRLLGRPAVDILGLPLARLWPQEDRFPVEEAINQVRRGEKAVFEMPYHHPLGMILGWQIILNPIVEADGRVHRFVGIIADVTERQQAAVNLQYRLELEALIARISTEFINLPSERIDEGINRALETLGRFTGVDRAYVFQLHDQGRLASNTYEWCADGITPEQAGLQGLLLDAELPWFAGIIRKFEVFCVNRVVDLPSEAAAEKAEFQREGIQSLVIVPMVHQESLVGFFGFDAVREAKVWNEDTITILNMVADLLVNVLERQRAEEALAAEKERLAVTLSSIGDAVIATDIKGNIQLMNHVAEELTGWSLAEAMGRPVMEICQIFDSRSRQACTTLIPRILVGESTGTQTHYLISRDGREILLADSGAPIVDQHHQVLGAVLVFRNITLKRRLEEELSKVEKLRSLGILAGGLAHDFNNILTAILGNISLGLHYAEDGKELANLRERLVEAERAALRARDLVQQLLTFAKGGVPVKQLASLKEIVEESAGFTISGSQSRCRFNLPADLWPVEVDEGQISQVVQNLVLNAAQAMPEGGAITLSAENVWLDDASGLPLQPGRYVKLTIADQGIGIPTEYLPRIFDPYFSTKQQGSGLGLATVYSIVTNHEGHITVESQLGRGTSFAIFLPASSGEEVRKESSRPVLYPGAGRILVMDDEPMVREVVGRMLEQLGYEVELAADGREALRLFQAARERSQPFAGIILDLTVPEGMGGQETMSRLQALEPGVVSLVSSGYSEDTVMTQYRNYGFKGFIKKPYRIEEISRALYGALHES